MEKQVQDVQSPLTVTPSVKEVYERPLVSRDNYEAFREQQLASLKTMKEEWVEVFQGQIPKDKYAIHLKFGEMVYEDLASVYLEGEYY